MPSTVSACFQKFRTDFVDLPTEQTKTARSSRDFLYDQIKALKDASILSGATQSFGSFARHTKMRPLDDIDCLSLLQSAETTETWVGPGSYTYGLKAKSTASPLYAYTDSNGFVNSTKVLNAVKKALESVSQYKQSDIGRNGSAVVLNLKSYDWSFDVVPACAVTAQGASGTSYFIIPDGNGTWKRTDPRADGNRTSAASGKHNGNFLPAVRLLKYWNRRTNKPRLSSYYFETLLTNRALAGTAYVSVQAAVEDLLFGVRETVLNSCADPKGHEPALDSGIDSETKRKVRDAASTAWHEAYNAGKDEANGRHKEAISRWKTVFGNDFPSYG